MSICETPGKPLSGIKKLLFYKMGVGEIQVKYERSGYFEGAKNYTNADC